MALTGQFMILYVIAHVIGNYTIFAGAINAYAEGLRHWPYIVVLWCARTLLFLSVVLHTYYGIVLKLENRNAKPTLYAVTAYRAATFSGRTMIWSGLAIALYLLFHLLHFTFQVIDPSFGAINHPDSLGRPDVLTMVIKGFRQASIAAVYVAGVAALGLHLYHGIESAIQTEGLNNDRSMPAVVKTGMALSILLFAMYAVIPIAIWTGLFE